MGIWTPSIEGKTYQTFGSLGSTDGVAMTASATANAMGSWATIISSMPFEAQGILVQLRGEAAGSIDFHVEIGIGPDGAEKVILPRLLACESGDFTCRHYYFPIRVPEGVRIAGRCQATTASSIMHAVVTVFTGGFIHTAPFGRVTAYGVLATDSGGATIDPGATANTKGTWSILETSTANPMRALIVAIGNITNSARVDGQHMLDIGVGTGAGSGQKVILPDLFIDQGAASDFFNPLVFGPFPCDIPSGVDLRARQQSTITNATDRIMDVSVYGID